MRIKQTGRQKCFRRRDKLIKKLGFKDYKEYLKSDIWKRIRTEVLTKRKFKCFYCKEKATEVHHLRYTRPVLMGEGNYYLGGLVALCRNCHQNISDFAKKEKIHEATAFQITNIKLKNL